ncbi:Conserved_hypothetical protein [Hexamita inflata]|uniref:Uncharacterized protein n=1 Tax=Hexamita inflata TaxID=28002 RepID=A0AA86RR48_9EUKA|nr:Conserved hypothetical protein [Hexamita inflata]
MSVKISKIFPKRSTMVQALQLIQPYISHLEADARNQIEQRVRADFHEILLEILQDDPNLQIQFEQQRPSNYKQFISAYFLCNYSVYVRGRCLQILAQRGLVYKQTVLIGVREFQVFNEYLSTFSSNNSYYLDVGCSYFLIQFWLLVWECVDYFSHINCSGKCETSTQTDNQQFWAQTQTEPDRLILVQNQLINQMQNQIQTLFQENERLKKQINNQKVEEKEEGVELDALDVGALRTQLWE